MPMQCQEEYLPGQILQKHVMQCWFLPMVCRSQGINNCYNHCLSTFADPWFILTNWWILVDHGSNHIVILIDFLHPPVTWHLFPQSEFEATSSKADVYPRPRLDTWRTALPSLSQCQYICWNSHWFSHFPFPQGLPWISEDFPALARGWPCCLSGRKSNKGHCSLNSTETVRSKCEFTIFYEL